MNLNFSDFKIFRYFVLTTILCSIFYILYPVFVASAAVRTSVSVAGPTNGLVGYWTFDGKDMNWGTNKALDRSGQGNDGLLVGMSTTTSPAFGQIGQTLNFNSVNKYITTALNTGLSGDVTTTFSAWIYATNNTQAFQTIISQAAADVGGKCINLTLRSGKLTLDFCSGGWTQSSTLQTNRWYHVVGVKTPGVMSATTKLYVDGVDVTSGGSFLGGADSTPNVTNSSVVLGTFAASLGSATNFNGKIDDVRIYNRALSAREIKSLYNVGAMGLKSNTSLYGTGVSMTGGLVGYWPFDGKDTSWTTNKTLDRSGNGNTGTLVLMSTTTSPSMGRIGQSLRFAGTGGYVNAGTNDILQITGSYVTTSAWIKTTANQGTIIQRTSSSGSIPGYGMAVGGNLTNGKLSFWYGNGVSWSQSASTVNDNKWHHVAVAFDSVNSYFYIDGALNATVPKSGTVSLSSSGVPFVVGVDGTDFVTWNFSGFIDDVRVYSRFLSAGEIQKIYQQGVAGITTGASQTSKNLPINSGLMGLWTFDGKDTNWGTNQVYDRSGQGNTGTFINMSTTSSPVQGKIGQGLSFNGSNSYVDLGTKFPSITSAITVSAWVNPGTTQMTYADIWGNHQGDWKGMVIQQNAGSTNQYSFAYGDGVGWTNTTGLFNITANTWTHLVAVKDSSNCYIYLNGVEQVVVRGSCPANIVPATTMNFSAGLGFSGGGRYFNGKIDDIRVYGRALSASEVKNLYNMGK